MVSPMHQGGVRLAGRDAADEATLVERGRFGLGLEDLGDRVGPGAADGRVDATDDVVSLMTSSMVLTSVWTVGSVQSPSALNSLS